MLEQCKASIIEVKDFPKPGIGFKDLTPLVENPEYFRFICDSLAEWAGKHSAERVLCIESRGFLFGGPVAYNLGVGLAVVRKKGKLPRETLCVRAPNEYAVEHFEIHRDSIAPGIPVVILDDLIATGSSSIAAIDLVKQLGGRPAGFAAVVDLAFLGGIPAIRKAHPEVDVFSLITFEE
jgi:adenine phosphoribosyltransferase